MRKKVSQKAERLGIIHLKVKAAFTKSWETCCKYHAHLTSASQHLQLLLCGAFFSNVHT